LPCWGELPFVHCFAHVNLSNIVLAKWACARFIWGRTRQDCFCYNLDGLWPCICLPRIGLEKESRQRINGVTKRWIYSYLTVNKAKFMTPVSGPIARMRDLHIRSIHHIVLLRALIVAYVLCAVWFYVAPDTLTESLRAVERNLDTLLRASLPSYFFPICCRTIL